MTYMFRIISAIGMTALALSMVTGLVELWEESVGTKLKYKVFIFVLTVVGIFLIVAVMTLAVALITGEGLKS